MMTYNMNDKMERKFFENELMRGRDYLDYVKEVLHSGRVAAAKRGCYLGSRPPFGYSRAKLGKDHTLVPNENADIVRLIFEWYVNDNLSYGQIAKRLNEMGIKTILNGKWAKDAVSRITQNRHYIGQVVYNRRQKVVTVENGQQRKRLFYMPEDEWIIAEGKQIVCDATIGDVTSFGGATLDVNAFGCTIRFNGKPTITDAPVVGG